MIRIDNFLHKSRQSKLWYKEDICIIQSKGREVALRT